MKIVITQPNYLPWLGYFAQLQACDLWVVLDDVQYARREWQNRNRIVGITGKPEYLTLPLKKTPRSTMIKEVILSHEYDPDMHLADIRRCYVACPYYSEIYPILADILSSCYTRSGLHMSNLNTFIVKEIFALVEIELKSHLSSQLPSFTQSNSPTERLCQISRYFQATTYLSSPGAKKYMLNELEVFNKVSINVAWQNFNHVQYPQHQHRESFISHMSFIDYLFNCGISGFSEYLRKCHGEEHQSANL